MKMKIVTLGKSEFEVEFPLHAERSIYKMCSDVQELFEKTSGLFTCTNGRHIVLPTASIDYIEVLP